MLRFLLMAAMLALAYPASASTSGTVILDRIGSVIPAHQSENWIGPDRICSRGRCGEVWEVHENGFVYQTEANYGEGKVIGVETEQGPPIAHLWREGNRKFDLLEVDLIAYGNELFEVIDEIPYGWYYEEEDIDRTKPIPLLYGISGYRKDKLVDQITFWNVGESCPEWRTDPACYYGVRPGTFEFDNKWKNLTSVWFEILLPENYGVYGGDIGDLICLHDYCGNLNVTRLEVAPVPLPASGLMLLVGIASALTLRRCTRIGA